MKQKRFLLIILVFLMFFPLSTEVFGENHKVDQVYLLVINRLSLEDFKESKNLNKISEDGSLGLMNTRGTNGYYGAESFLTINSSSKAYANDISSDFVYSKLTDQIINASMSRIYNLNNDNRYNPKIGFLGDRLKNGDKTTAIFADNTLEEESLLYSGLIAMNSQGIISEGMIDGLTLEDNNYPYEKKMDYKKLLDKSIESEANFKVLDISDLERLYRYSTNYTEDEYFQHREEILTDIDVFLGELLKEINFDNSTLIITSPNAADPIVDQNKLAPIVLYGSGISQGGLISSTTNREGIVANIDIAPTILELFGIDPSGAGGKVIKTKETIKDGLDEMLNEKEKIYTVSSIRYKALLFYGVYSIIVLSITILLKLGRFRLSDKFRNFRNALLEMILIIPTVYLLVSIIQPKEQVTYIGIIIGIIVLLIGILYKTRNSDINKRLLYFSCFNVGLLLLDLVLNGSLSRFSVLSHDPIIGARYYGIGNEMVGLLLGNIAILLRQLKQRGIDKKVNMLVLIIGVIFVGHPRLGANVGGTLALLSAFIFYVIEELEIKINIKRLFLIGVIIIAIIGIVAFIDINFNSNTTHLGNTILSIKEEGVSEIFQIIFRKLLMNIKLIGNSFWTFVLLADILGFGITIYLNREYNSEMLKVSIAMIMGVIAGFLLNDSGLILAAICMNFLSAEHIIMGSESFEKS